MESGSYRPSTQRPSLLRLLASYNGVSPYIEAVCCVQGSVTDYGHDHRRSSRPRPRPGDRENPQQQQQQQQSFLRSAIVNAANEGCLGGGGVDGAISSAGGPRLQQDRLDLPIINQDDDDNVSGMGFGRRSTIRCRTGGAVITGPNHYHKLRVPFVIHAVGPDYWDFGPKHIDDAHNFLVSAYQQSLDRAYERGIRRVGFSLLSAGIFRAKVPLLEILQVSMYAIRTWVPTTTESITTTTRATANREGDEGKDAKDAKDADKEEAKEDVGGKPAAATVATAPEAQDEPPKTPTAAPARPPLVEVAFCGFTDIECQTLMRACNLTFDAPTTNSPVAKKQKAAAADPESDTKPPPKENNDWGNSVTMDDAASLQTDRSGIVSAQSKGPSQDAISKSHTTAKDTADKSKQMLDYVVADWFNTIQGKIPGNSVTPNSTAGMPFAWEIFEADTKERTTDNKFDATNKASDMPVAWDYFFTEWETVENDDTPRMTVGMSESKAIKSFTINDMDTSNKSVGMPAAAWGNDVAESDAMDRMERGVPAAMKMVHATEPNTTVGTSNAASKSAVSYTNADTIDGSTDHSDSLVGSAHELDMWDGKQLLETSPFKPDTADDEASNKQDSMADIQAGATASTANAPDTTADNCKEHDAFGFAANLEFEIVNDLADDDVSL